MREGERDGGRVRPQLTTGLESLKLANVYMAGTVE